MITRAGVAAAGAASAAAASLQTGQARVAPPAAAAATATAAPSAAATAACADADDGWLLLSPQQQQLDGAAAAPLTVPLLGPAAIAQGAADLRRVVEAARGGAGAGAGRALRRRASSSSSGEDEAEGAAADAVIRAGAPAPDPLLGAAERMLQQPGVQAAIVGGVAADPHILRLMHEAVFGGGGGHGGSLGLGAAAAAEALGAPRLPASPATTVRELPSGEEEEDEDDKAQEEEEELPLPYNPFDPVASLGHHLSRFGAWLRARVVDPLLGLADDQDDEEEAEGEEKEAALAAAAAAKEQQAPPKYQHRPRTPAEEGVKDAADAWLGALTAAMIAIVCLAILRRPAAAREFVRAALRGGAVMRAAAAGR